MSASAKDILAVLEKPVLNGSMSVEILGVTHDSRKVRKGWLFVAVPGVKTDGHRYVSQAVAAGAAAILAQEPCPEDGPRDVPWIVVSDTRSVLGRVAAVVYGRPTEKMTVVGITGTNGKTSLTFLLESILKAAGRSPGVVGTVNYRWAGREVPASHTTPESSALQELFKCMLDAFVTHAVMEVSSHGLHLGRLDGCHFDIGVFTNLTQDHLDYHGNLEDYYQAKKLLFTQLLPSSSKPRPTAVINMDDPYGRRLVDEIQGLPTITFGLSEACDVRPLLASLRPDGISATMRTPSGSFPITSALTGSFNLSNLLAAVAVSHGLGIDRSAVQEGLAGVTSIPGRLERVASDHGMAFVDYAHTPNALKNVLDALQIIRRGRIITVMGCGGDRDRTKRPLMGMEAAAGSDFVVITSDNPRSEDPLAIIDEIEKGVIQHGFSKWQENLNGEPLANSHYRTVPDRRQAIAWAVNHMQDDDILLVAGKGHETYQEIKGVRHPFDDRVALAEELLRRCAPSDTEPGLNQHAKKEQAHES